ncbi:Uncharacterised protein [Haemophilus haemolyticus]|nr:Uncharacterised protein [Haemophilus haemolyticus]
MLPALVAAVRPLVSKMDFQFTHYQGNVSVKCSMEHIALANWFNTEVRSNPKAILTALSTAQSLSENQEEILIGAEYTLFLDADEVMVRANNLAIETDEILEDDFHYYDEESIAFCGTQDFIYFLEAYVDFIS